MKGCSRIIILGHTGFIGRHLLAYLQQQATPVPVLGFSTSEIDLTDFEAVRRLGAYLDEHTAVIHCSAIQKWVKDDLETFEHNVCMVSNVLRLLQVQLVRHFIYFSSAAVYGESVTNLNIVEETSLAPSNYYGIAKLACEQITRAFANARPSLLLTILRPSLVYGEDNSDKFYIPAGFIQRALGGRVIKLWGDGEELRDYIHIDDVCALVGKILQAGIVGTFNLCSGQAVSYRNVLAMIERSLDCKLTIEEIPRTRPKVSLIMRNDKLMDACGGYQFLPMPDAIQRITQVKRGRARVV